MSGALALAEALGHEEVVIVRDPASGLRAVIAIHDTTLGRAVGGTRMRPYASLDAAMTDALRLSRAMTYKSAMAGMACGGGKAVILGDPARDKSRPLLAAYCKALDRLGGRFHSGPDMGIEQRDVTVMARMTKHVSSMPSGSNVDTGGLTAIGVQESVRAAARFLGLRLSGLHVALQGLGQVGLRLARLLAADGVRLTVADVDEGRALRAGTELGVAVVAPDAIYDVECDVFSPNAAGGVLNDATVGRLRCAAVVGAANEQVEEPRHADALHARGILLAPDYLVNAGGLLSLTFELGETDEEGVVERVRLIGDRLFDLLQRARSEGVPPPVLADRIVEERLAAARPRR